MSWSIISADTASASANNTAGDNQATAANQMSNLFSIEWRGIHRSWADGYEWAGQERWVQYGVDTTDWPNRISRHRYYVRVHPNPHFAQTTAGIVQDGPWYNFLFFWAGDDNPEPYQWDHYDQLTVNFAPIPEAEEVMPETFLKFLERIGHDDDYLRLQIGKQKEHWDAAWRLKGQLPPWDPRKVEELEQKRLRWREALGRLTVDRQESIRDRLMERWGIEEIPPITPELLDQIEANSRQFLVECLSPEELEFFDEHGHCKIRSPSEPEIYYIVKVGDEERVGRYREDQLIEKICIHSLWDSMPALDTVAMKVLNIKHNEEGFLKTGNRTYFTAKGEALFIRH